MTQVDAGWVADDPNAVVGSGPAGSRVTQITDPFGNRAQDWHGYYAGFGSRLMAYLVDGVVILVGFYALVGLGALFIAVVTLERPNAPALPDVAWFVMFVVWATTYLSYTVTVYGKTAGKSLIGLRVVTKRGERVGFVRAFLRVPAYIASYIVFCLGFIWIGISKTRRGWHDYLVGTCVIYDWDARPGARYRAARQRRRATDEL